MKNDWQIHNPGGSFRIIVTKQLLGDRWIKILTDAGCRLEVCESDKILSKHEVQAAIARRCDGVIGQLSDPWDKEMFSALKAAGGKVYSNYGVGYNNVDVVAATSQGICVGNTPGVLTDATAELAVALTFAAARRIAEGDGYVRKGKFKGWQLTLLLGELLARKTVGVVGAGRIGSAYARMMVEGQRMNLIYFGRKRNEALEASVIAFNQYLNRVGEKPVQFRKAETLEELLRESDVVSLHTTLNENTRHLIDARCLTLMKKNAILINVSRGPVVDEEALVEHCRKNPEFRVGLDVYEDEPALKPGLSELSNAVLVPHIGSATRWTREAMSIIAARNVAGILLGYPAWKGESMDEFLGDNPPRAAPSILNAKELGM
jgi:hydroxypyruvate reductase 1